MSKDDIILDFDRRIIEHQPLTYLKVVARRPLYSFSPVRGDGPENYPIWYHQFHTYFPVVRRSGTIRPPDAAHTGPSVEPALADFLTGYGRTSTCRARCSPPVSRLGVAGMAGIGRARRSGLRAPACFSRSASSPRSSPCSSSPPSTGGTNCRNSSLIPIAAVLGVTALVGAGPATGPRYSAMSTYRLVGTGHDTGERAGRRRPARRLSRTPAVTVAEAWPIGSGASRGGRIGRAASYPRLRCAASISSAGS